MTPTQRLTEALAGRYTIERELGAGGMAMVYLANDLRHRRKVAIKVLRPELAATLGPERFLREIETVAGLRHPHILPLYDSGESDGFLFYVMPLVEGESLRDRLRRDKQLPIEDALHIAAEVADALSYAHSRGVVHRDIKPENILLESGHALVADFGIAKISAPTGSLTSLTVPGTGVGTPAYMSPEQASGDGDIDGRSDVYSLGCVLYEMLVGQPPFLGATVEVLLRQHILAHPIPVAQLRPTVPPAVSDAVTRALAKTPADRFARVDHFINALAHHQTTTSVPGGRMGNWRLGLRVAMAVVAFGVAAWFFLQYVRAPEDGSSPSLAVLPFVNLSGDSATDPVVLGMHVEIITRLSKIPGIRVTSRSSAMEFRNSQRKESEIAHGLGVTHLLTGSIQRSGNQIRFTAALSGVRDGHGIQLWTESFDRSYTAENLFAIQADIATAVAVALSPRFASTQDTAVRQPPTTNTDALNLYYRAMHEWNQERTALNTAIIGLLQDAVAMDSNFAAAWGLLAQSRSWALRMGLTSDTLPASEAVHRVQTIAPGSLDAILASGYYAYYGKGDFVRALHAMEAASVLVPNSSEVMLVRALLLRRLNRWNEAVDLLRAAAAQDPRYMQVMHELGETLVFMRRWDDAASELDRALALSPANSSIIASKFTLLILRGDTAGAAAFLAAATPILSGSVHTLLQVTMSRIRRDYSEAIQFARMWDSELYGIYGSRDEQVAVLSWLVGDSARARAAADSLLESSERMLARTRPGYSNVFGKRSQFHLGMAIGYGLMGDRARAVAVADSALAGYPPAADAVDGVHLLRPAAIAYMLGGQPDRAVAALSTLLSYPSLVSRELLRLDPTWDQLKTNAGFQRLVTAP